MKSSKKLCKSNKVRDLSTNSCRKRKSPTKSRKKSRKKSKTPCRSNQVRKRSTGRCGKTKKRYENAYSPDGHPVDLYNTPTAVNAISMHNWESPPPSGMMNRNNPPKKNHPPVKKTQNTKNPSWGSSLKSWFGK